jgi:hypothetical protein
MTQTKSATDAIETGSTATRALAVGAFALGAAAIGSRWVQWPSGVCEFWRLALKSSPLAHSQWTI